MRYFGLLFIATIMSLNVSGQIFDPVSWNFKTEHVGGSEYDLIFRAEIDEGWSVYSQHIEEGGPIPTSFTFDEGAHYEMIKDVSESDNAKSGMDMIFEMQVTKFYNYAEFTQRVEIMDFKEPITGYLTFMTCDAERCLPPKDVDYSFTLKPAGNNKVNLGAGESDGGQNAKAGKGEKIVQVDAVVENRTENKTDQTNQVQEVNKATKTSFADQKKPDEVEKTQKVEIDDVEFAPIEIDLGDEQDDEDSKILDPIKWDYDIKAVGDGVYDLIFHAKGEKGWYLYSQFLEEDGPVPTTIYFDDSDGFTVEGQAQEDGPNRVEGFDKIFEMDVVKFKEEATFTQRVKVTDPELVIHGEVEYMTCDDEKCIFPPTAEFTFIPAKGIAQVGAINAGGTGSTIKLDGAVLDNSISSIQETYLEPLGKCADEENTRDQGMLWTFVFGFIGGLLALLTPCVFPMIPLTVSFFTKDTKRKGWWNGVMYGLSIIVIYVALGLLITAIAGPAALNGLSTDPIANTLFFLIFLFFAFSFFGFYEITLPSSLANKSDSMADKGGLIGIFFMAFTLAIVSFSCTGPIIGSALVEAASSGMMGPAVVMFGFALALAIPFGLFAAFPSWLNSLPRSGGWMNSVKVMLGFLELALAFKFLSVADMTSHWGIVKYELFLGIWVLVAIGMTLYIFGIIKFPHDSPVKKLNMLRLVMGSSLAVLAVYLASGFMYNDETKTYCSLKLLSGLAPPANYNFFLPKQEGDETIKSRFASFSKCANNLDCFKDYYEGLEYAKETGKPILLDFTGYGCVNCRKTEEHIWVHPSVKSKIENDYVLISLYVDDKKPLDEILFSKEENRKLRTVGHKWADFQIVNFQQNSQPLYVLLSPDEKVLADPRGYKTDVEGYSDFLDCGLQTFKLQGDLLGSR